MENTLDLLAPSLPESVADGELIRWHVAPGEHFAQDTVLAEIETDKVVLEVPAPEDGVLLACLVDEGENITSRQVLAHWQQADADGVPASESAASVPSTQPAPAASKAGPVVRKLAVEQGVSLDRVPPSGPRATVTVQDIQQAVQDADEQEKSNAKEETAGRHEQRQPVSRIRKRIAERLLQAQRETACLTTFNEVDLGQVQALRQRFQERFVARHGCKLGLMSLFVQACVQALHKLPQVNARLEGEELVTPSYHDIGMAVSTPRGLVVPVLRDAQCKSLAEIETWLRDTATRARAGKISLEELQGGTFSITNGGVFGSMLSTPLLNPPQSAILGMHRIQDRPMVDAHGQIVVRPMMYLALSYDHRVIDGQEAVTFLTTVKECLEYPALSRLQLD